MPIRQMLMIKGPLDGKGRSPPQKKVDACLFAHRFFVGEPVIENASVAWRFASCWMAKSINLLLAHPTGLSVEEL